MREQIAMRSGFIAGLAFLAAVLSFNAAQAQIRYLPGAAYDQTNILKPQSVQLRLEAMRESNDFERLAVFREDSRLRRIARPVGRLKIKMKDAQMREGTALCTASIISSEYLLTNYHCIPGILGVTVLSAKVEMGYIDAADTSRVRVFEVDIHPVEADSELDYAVVRVHGNPAGSFGVMKISTEPPRPMESIFIIHHPEGAPKTLSRKDCRVILTSTDQFVHSCDTLGGSSGSPIISEETYRMVGLHYASSANGNHGIKLEALLSKSPILESLIVVSNQPDILPAKTNLGLPVPTKATDISLDSEPTGAAIYYQGALIGVTPYQFSVAAAGNAVFELHKEGYDPAIISVPAEDKAFHRTVTLRRNQAGKGAPRQPPPDDPAAEQVKNALKFWDNLVESGYTGMEEETPPPRTKAEEQMDKARSFFQSLQTPDKQ